MRRSWIGLIVAAQIATGAAAATAHADGLPVLGIDVGGVGVTTPTDAAQFVTMRAGANTIRAVINPLPLVLRAVARRCTGENPPAGCLGVN